MSPVFCIQNYMMYIRCVLEVEGKKNIGIDYMQLGSIDQFSLKMTFPKEPETFQQTSSSTKFGEILYLQKNIWLLILRQREVFVPKLKSKCVTIQKPGLTLTLIYDQIKRLKKLYLQKKTFHKINFQGQNFDFHAKEGSYLPVKE